MLRAFAFIAGAFAIVVAVTHHSWPVGLCGAFTLLLVAANGKRRA